MVANDMHLGLNLPNIWYRVRLIVTGDEPGDTAEESGDPPTLDAAGVTLPGTPLVVAGSNGSIAWGFTNSRGDWSDLVLIETDPDDPGAYLTPDGYVPFDEYEEIIEIRGAEPAAVTYRWTRWGPVVGTDHRGRLQALRWLAHVPEAVDLGISELETLTSVTEALALAPRVGIPPQNFVVADAQGSIGWTIMGRIPRRAGYDSSLPASWADGSAGWRGWLAPEEYPRVVDPESGLIWTANNRIVDGEVLVHMGAAGYWLGARATQIRDALAAVGRPRIEDMLAIQLDDRALLLQEWRDVLLEALTAEAAAPYPWADELRAFLQRWDGRAGIDSVSYRIVREFRRQVVEEVLRGVLSGCGDFDGPVQLAATNQVEGPIWQIDRGAAGSPAAPSARVLERPADERGRFRRVHLRRRPVVRVHLGEHESARYPASVGRGPRVAPSVADDPRRTAAGRRPHAPNSAARLRRLGTLRRGARRRSQRLLPHAGRSERASPVPLLRRRTRGLGAGRTAALPAGAGVAPPDAGAGVAFV